MRLLAYGVVHYCVREQRFRTDEQAGDAQFLLWEFDKELEALRDKKPKTVQRWLLLYMLSSTLLHLHHKHRPHARYLSFQENHHLLETLSYHHEFIIS